MVESLDTAVGKVMKELSDQGLADDTLVIFTSDNGGVDADANSAIRDGDWKLIRFYETSAVRLYNLRTDIGKRNDLSQRNPARVRDLSGKLDIWLRETDARLPIRNPGFLQ